MREFTCIVSALPHFRFFVHLILVGDFGISADEIDETRTCCLLGVNNDPIGSHLTQELGILRQFSDDLFPTRDHVGEPVVSNSFDKPAAAQRPELSELFLNVRVKLRYKVLGKSA